MVAILIQNLCHFNQLGMYFRHPVQCPWYVLVVVGDVANELRIRLHLFQPRVPVDLDKY